MKQTLQVLYNETIRFLTNKRFILHLAAIVLFVFIIIIGVLLWLRFYTHHGQKIEMPDYINMPIVNATKDAGGKSFQLIVNDSVHIVGVPGGIIRLQNPEGGTMVKQNRKVYVTVSKYIADQINLADLYEIYGQNYDLKAAEFRSRGLNTKIKETRYDNITENVILEVWYKGQKIISSSEPPEKLMVEKGSTLEFIISSSSGGFFPIPDLIGKSVTTARFMARTFTIGSVRDVNGNPVENEESAIVIRQDPDAYTTGINGQIINLVVRVPN